MSHYFARMMSSPVYAKLRESGKRVLSQLPTALRDLPEDQAPPLAQGSYRDLLDNVIFRGEHPPRWVLLLAGSDSGRYAIEDDRGAVREGKEALRAITDQWRLGGTRIPEVYDIPAFLL